MIELSEAVQADVNNSLMGGHPMVVCAVTPEGLPTLSWRGSMQTRGADALAIWVRKPDTSTLLQSIAVQPVVVAAYSDMGERHFYQFTGRARVETDEAARKEIFENSPELERQQDPELTGAAVVIELDRAGGRSADGPFQMERD